MRCLLIDTIPIPDRFDRQCPSSISYGGFGPTACCMCAALCGVSCAALCYVICLCAPGASAVHYTEPWAALGCFFMQMLCGALLVVFDGLQSCAPQAVLRTGAGALWYDLRAAHAFIL